MADLERHIEAHQMDLVSWALGNEDYDQNRKIYIDPDNPARFITASGARCIVRKLVAGFKAIGLQPGDCVCLHAFNDIMYTMLFLGILGAGGRFTGSNPAYTSAELSHHLGITKSRFLISEPELFARIAPAIEECSLPVLNVLVFDPTGRDFPLYYRSWRDLLNHGESDWIRFESQDASKHTTAALLSTSGTTGLPKAAMISHYNCVIQNAFLNDSKDKSYKVSRIITLPEFHAFAFPIAHIAPLREGITTYIMRRFDLNRYLSAIQQYAITETPMVPQILRMIVEHPQLAQHTLKSLRLVWSAGAPLSVSLQELFCRLVNPAARVIQVWGMTEAGWISTFLWPEEDRTGSVGRLLPGMEAKLIHDEGYEIQADEISAEVFVRGPTIMQGYLGNPKATENAFDMDGWLKTGDIAYKRQGKLYIVDRRKEMIKVRGWQVSPAELEATLLLHPDISDAAVIGVRLKRDAETELPRAYVVTKPNSRVSEGEVQNFMAEKVAKFKALDGGVVFVGTIPRSSAGKILKNMLRDQATTEIRDAQAESAKTSLVSVPMQHSTGHDRTSANSSVISCDPSNEIGLRSRQNSTSTAGTAHSESTNWTSGSGFPNASANDHLKPDLESQPQPCAIIIPTPQAGNSAGLKLRAFDEHAFTEGGGSLPYENSSLVGQHKDLDSLHKATGSPSFHTNHTKSYEVLANTNHEVVPHDHLKKRTGETMEMSDVEPKKLKFDDEASLSSPTSREASVATEMRKKEA